MPIWVLAKVSKMAKSTSENMRGGRKRDLFWPIERLAPPRQCALLSNGRILHLLDYGKGRTSARGGLRHRPKHRHRPGFDKGRASAHSEDSAHFARPLRQGPRSLSHLEQLAIRDSPIVICVNFAKNFADLLPNNSGCRELSDQLSAADQLRLAAGRRPMLHKSSELPLCNPGRSRRSPALIGGHAVSIDCLPIHHMSCKNQPL
jgi:hypothetical protein